MASGVYLTGGGGRLDWRCCHHRSPLQPRPPADGGRGLHRRRARHRSSCGQEGDGGPRARARAAALLLDRRDHRAELRRRRGGPSCEGALDAQWQVLV
eukprot:scaffold135663_cov199-Phaeocystis_antarctica.AAC.1